jgi:hypothetical protein
MYPNTSRFANQHFTAAHLRRKSFTAAHLYGGTSSGGTSYVGTPSGGTSCDGFARHITRRVSRRFFCWLSPLFVRRIQRTMLPRMAYEQMRVHQAAEKLYNEVLRLIRLVGRGCLAAKPRIKPP